MSDLPLSHSYNLARLGQAGDEVRFEADSAQRAAIAQFAGIVSVERLAVQVGLKKPSPGHFLLAYRVLADITQSCVVTLAPVAGHIDCAFSRELRLATGRQSQAKPQAKPLAEPPAKLGDIELSELEEEPEEIENPHFDLAGPALEEFSLALDPYPRCPGVKFDPGQVPAEGAPSPFAVLKSLKSST